jgi:hypothetical protein
MTVTILGGGIWPGWLPSQRSTKYAKKLILKEQDHSRKGLSESQNRTHSEFALRHQLTSKMDYTTTTANKGLYFRVDEDRQPCGFDSEA